MVSTSTLAATIKISNYLNLRHKSVIIPSSSSISFFSSSARTRSFAITLLKPIRATAQQKYVYPDPIPEFSVAETLKFRAELTKKLMKDNDEFGDQIYDVVNVCAEEERESLARSETTAIRISNIANMLLFAAKVYASIQSGSLPIIASTLDSLLDLLSGFILWFTAFTMQISNPYQYPIGRTRMQPLGILVFASVMATLGLQIILVYLRTFLSKEAEFHLTKEQHW